MLVDVDYGRAPTQTARLRVLRGNVTRCDAEDWGARAGECPANPELERASTACLESLDLSNTRWFHAPRAVTVAMYPADQADDAVGIAAGLIRTVAGGASGSMAICYEPNGITRWTTRRPTIGTAMNFSTLNQGVAGGGGALFAVGLYDRDENQLVNTPRIVLFPLAGTPRRLR
jgi:hypothetical protein